MEDGLPSGDRVDIHCTYRSRNQDVTLVIENKIGRDKNVTDQIQRYMSQIGQGDNVYYFIFSFDETLEQFRKTIEKNGIRLFLIKEMAEFFSNQEVEDDDILKSYKQFICSRYDKSYKARRALEKGEKSSGGHLYEAWMETASRQGVEELFKCYLSFIEETDGEQGFNKGNSVAARYQDGKGGCPIFSV